MQTHLGASLADYSFENMMTKDEIARNEQFLLWLQCFQFFVIFKHKIRKIFHYFAYDLNKLSAADIFYVGKGYLKTYLEVGDLVMSCNSS